MIQAIILNKLCDTTQRYDENSRLYIRVTGIVKKKYFQSDAVNNNG
jgi:hypothetical protein